MIAKHFLYFTLFLYNVELALLGHAFWVGGQRCVEGGKGGSTGVVRRKYIIRQTLTP